MICLVLADVFNGFHPAGTHFPLSYGIGSLCRGKSTGISGKNSGRRIIENEGRMAPIIAANKRRRQQENSQMMSQYRVASAETIN